MNRFMLVGCAVLLAAAMLACPLGCKKRKARSHAPVAQPAPIVLPDRQACSQWGKMVEQTISAGDPNYLISTFDVDQLARRMLVNVKLPADANPAVVERGFVTGSRNAMPRVPQALARECAAGSKYKYIRVKDRSGQRVVLMRMLDAQGAVLYHEWLMTTVGGQVRAVDVYLIIAGQYMSETIAPVLTQAFARRPGDATMQDVLALMQHIKNKQWDQAMHAYRRLPPEVQKTKPVMLAHVDAAENISEVEGRKAQADYLALFGEDASSALIRLLHYSSLRKYDECMRMLDILERDLGNDAYLYYFRSNVWLKKGDLQQAQNFALWSIKAEPDFEDAWWTQVTVSLQKQDFAETSRLLKHIEEVLGVGIADLTQVEEYAEYVKSPQYEAWMASRPSAQTPATPPRP